MVVPTHAYSVPVTLRQALKKQPLSQLPSPAARVDLSRNRERCRRNPLPVPGDDCMDAGGRVTPGAVTEGRVRVFLAYVFPRSGADYLDSG
jgi:hypothetical protein